MRRNAPGRRIDLCSPALYFLQQAAKERNLAVGNWIQAAESTLEAGSWQLAARS
jgi:hypothetical protein